MLAAVDGVTVALLVAVALEVEAAGSRDNRAPLFLFRVAENGGTGGQVKSS